MKLITKHTDYAVRALAHLSTRTKGFTSSDKIAHIEKIPAYFLRRIISVLKKEGILDSKEGKSGGVRLIVRPRDIRIIYLIKIFQGGIVLTECKFRKNACPNRRGCKLRKRILKAEKRLVRDIKRIKLSDLL